MPSAAAIGFFLLGKEDVMKRRKMSRSGSKRYFTAGAGRVHKKNMQSSVGSMYAMRGGIRL